MPVTDDAGDGGLPDLDSIPATGLVVVTGPSNVGKTRLTARLLDRWVAEYGPDGVVVLDFAPELHRDGRLLGGRLSRFTAVPDLAWTGVLAAHAPRAEGEDEDDAVSLARDNAERAARLLAAAPADPRAVFVNDATIPFQHEVGALDEFLAYCERAAFAACNAFDSDELGTDDPVSRRERAALRSLRARADVTVELD
jgi:hypothetical protein